MFLLVVEIVVPFPPKPVPYLPDGPPAPPRPSAPSIERVRGGLTSPHLSAPSLARAQARRRSVRPPPGPRMREARRCRTRRSLLPALPPLPVCPRVAASVFHFSDVLVDTSVSSPSQRFVSDDGLWYICCWFIEIKCELSIFY